MRLKSLLLASLLVIASATGARAAGWIGAPNARSVVNFYVATYPEGEAFYFLGSDNQAYYFNLNGSELSRQMTAAVMSAYYKAKRVDICLTDHLMPGSTWKEVCGIGVVN
jgi:hypothetical protein